ncbi:alpha/beta fold hydrolase [Thermus oshimai]|jgi:carboxylesterase|uniref:alpha/beta hydrolase n=1 Tax=Thermus TaxID=270 RepID=UPI000378FDE8|nr:alpha/beta fold hydrolase [Thermus oshimai]
MAGVLLLHGLSSHPVLTLGPLPGALRAAGYAVAQPALPGHGTRPEDLRGVGWRDWYGKALEAYRALPEPKGVVGLSMGALLAAMLAAEEGASFLVALAPALVLRNPLAGLAPYLHPLIPKAPRTRSVSDAKRRRASPNYPWIPTSAVAELVRLQKAVDPLLPKVQAPALVVQALWDTTLSPKGVKRFYERLGSERKDLVAYESEHDLLLDLKAEEVARDVALWIRGVLPP